MRINLFSPLGKNLLVSGALLFMLCATQTIEAKNKTSEKHDVLMAAPQQSVKIKGQVVDGKTKETIVGATVLVKGTTTGAATDINGNFSLDVPSGATLVVSCIGYVPQEIPVGSQTTFNIALQPNAEQLDEVVVVGYTVQKKSNITSSVKNIGGEQLKDVTAPDISTMLQNKVAGVQVYSEGGAPGTSAKIRIRGKSSLGSSVDPLWVVDGVIQASEPFLTLNPEDVESISVLKDAAATSLYGSRATNGVIVVTTKRAKQGQSDIHVAARWGMGWINNGNFELMNSREIGETWKAMGRAIPDEINTVDFDWWDNATQMSLTQDYSVSFSGGTEKMKAFISGGYYNEEGAIKGEKIKRFRVLSNLDFQVKDWLKIKPKVSASYTLHDNAGTPGMYTLYTLLPFDAPYYEDGEITNPDQGMRPGHTWYGRDENNYLYDSQWNYDNTKEFRVQADFNFDIRLTDWLTFASTNNVQMSNWKEISYTDPRSNGGIGVNGSLYNLREDWRGFFSNQMLRFNKTFGNDWTVSALVAYEYSDFYSDQLTATKEGFFPGSEVMNNAAKPRDITGAMGDWAMNSVLSNVNVAYDNRYFIQASFRNDGSSRLGKDKRRGSFYSISGGWNVTNEKFMKERKSALWLTDMKVRVSYGGVGNLPNSNYPQYDLYSLTETYNGLNGLFPSQLGNSKLSWEKSYETNIGLDLRLFDRLTINADYYIKNTSDLVYSVTLPAVTGYTGYWDNIGAVVNKGVELAASVDILKDTDFKFSFDANWSLNRNKVDELYGGKDVISGWHIRREGKDMDTWYLRKWAGVDPNNGDPLWEVVNEDGTVSTTNNYNAATLQIVGRGTPDFSGGFATRMSYKGISLNTNWGYVVGNDIYHYDRELFDADGAYPTFNQMRLHDGWSRWEQPGDNATHPKLVNGGNNASNKTSSRYLEDGSYLRLRNITLTYQLPSQLLRKVGFKAASVSLSGDNLWTITDFSGRDPEVGENGEGYHKYPNVRKFVVGLNLNF